MNIFDYALKMEKDGENFYREIAQKTQHKGLREVMTMLSEQEAQHYITILKMKDQEAVEGTANSDILDATKIIFSNIDPETDFSEEKKLLDLFRKARDIEKLSMEFYSKNATETDNPEHTRIFEMLADEERKHFLILDNMVEFLAKPEQWLEFAEWYHLDEY